MFFHGKIVKQFSIKISEILYVSNKQDEMMKELLTGVGLIELLGIEKCQPGISVGEGMEGYLLVAGGGFEPPTFGL